MTGSGGLSVPFNSQKILKEPDLNVDRHMSVDQEEQLRAYFNVPAQPQSDGMAAQAQAAQGKTGQAQAGGQASQTQASQPSQAAGAMRPGQEARSGRDGAGGSPGATTRPDTAAQPGTATKPATATQPGTANQPGQANQQVRATGTGQEWLVRSEERIAVNLETQESGRVTLHKHIETEPVQEKVRVFHEEYEVERVPITGDDQVNSDMTDRDQEIILHEAHAVISKETVPVERIRLSVKKVEEEKTISDQVRKERVEIDSKADQPNSARQGDSSKRR